MSSNWLPRRDADLLEFAQQYSAQITADPTSLGLSAPVATELAGRVTDFQTKLAAATNGTTRGPSTVYAKKQSRKALVAYIRSTAKQIKATVTVTDQQRKDLKLPVPGESAPVGPPGTPEAITAELSIDGSLKLKWKCHNPLGSQGIMYQVWRKIGTAEPTYCGGTGNKRFVDNEVPSTASTITYQIQAVRSTAVGEWGQVNVNFGTGEAPAPESLQPKMAA